MAREIIVYVTLLGGGVGLVWGLLAVLPGR